MRALLDVNVIIALFDPDHAFHERAHSWWKGQMKFGWASCPLVENGVVRIMSHPNYSRSARFAPGDLVWRLQTFVEHTNHEFWPDDISLRDASCFAPEQLHSSSQLTDVYLLAMAQKHGGSLATFDAKILVVAARQATGQTLCVI
jgi:toxin-antitoxin system PIN domain toxin